MTLKIQDLIDMEQFQMLQDRLNEIYSFPSSIIDNDGKILTATAWQDVCTKFHRQNSECEKECIKSDQYILSHLDDANPAVSYRCPHGLIDNAAPIIIRGVHYGNFFTGQFFLEPPDLNFFRAQAKRYGFDEEAYIEAVKKVPIWTREQLNSYLFFIKGLIEVISGIGLKNLKEIEIRKKMHESEERHLTILQTALDGFWLVDIQGRLVEVNDAYCRMSGYNEQELLSMSVSELEVAEKAEDTAAHMQKIVMLGEDRFETRHRRKNGTIFDIEVSVQYRPDEGGQFVAFLRDITERKQAGEALKASLREKEVLLKEIQHRVKNNLLTISGILASQSERIKDSESKDAFLTSMNRINTMTKIHTRLYQSEDLSRIGFKVYMEELLWGLAHSYQFPRENIITDIRDISLDINTAIPAGLIINEIVSNACCAIGEADKRQRRGIAGEGHDIHYHLCR